MRLMPLIVLYCMLHYRSECVQHPPIGSQCAACKDAKGNSQSGVN